MTFKEYQEESLVTAIYPDKGENIIYPVLGLLGESGEVAEKLKKIIRDKDGELTESDVTELKKELGDVLWYIAAICYELNISMEDVAVTNVNKLKDRQNRNKLKGNGDNR